MTDKLYTQSDCRHKEIDNEGICKACGTKAAIRLPIGKDESGRLVDLSQLQDEVASKTYTQKEVDALIQAANEAALREVELYILSANLNMPVDQPMRMKAAAAIRELIIQPSALARIVEQTKASARAEGEEAMYLELESAMRNHLKNHPGLGGDPFFALQSAFTICRRTGALARRDEKMKAEFAAVLESAVNACAMSDDWDMHPKNYAKLVRAAIPTDYTYALDRRLAEARLEEALEWMQEHYTESNNADRWARGRVAELRRAVKGESDAK